ncbi:MAG: tryptophan 7-halogenase, partial [Gammaproteobacteria bacterium]|nr:tryptophan 7-halogenase [Gammaproteobacteria bacterium]
GLASGFLEPLESTAIHLIQSGISRLVSMFPHRDFDQRVIDEYNRRQRFEFESIRNFLVLHYTAVERDDSPFWRDCAAIRQPTELGDKIELFRASGLIHREGEELFTTGSWLQVMLGQGIVPRRYHRLADGMPAQQLRGFLNQMRGQIEHATATLPAHADFIARHCAGPTAPIQSAPA